MKTIAVYGIPNCDTVRKSLNWLNEQQIAHTFHNFKTAPIEKNQVKKWLSQLGIEVLLNKKSSTWRGFTPEQQAATTNEADVIDLLCQNPSAIKRPVVEWQDGSVTAGFKAEDWIKKAAK